MNIGIDMDDVCVDFQKRFVQLLNSLYGRPAIGTQPVDWSWSNCSVSEAELAAAWAASSKVLNFWFHMEPLLSFDQETVALLRRADREHEVTFITSRFSTDGRSALEQTEDWLRYNAGINYPKVIIASDKGAIATALELGAFFDDRPKNCVEVKEARPNALVYLADSSHNKTFHDGHIPRLKDLKEFLNTVGRKPFFLLGDSTGGETKDLHSVLNHTYINLQEKK